MYIYIYIYIYIRQAIAHVHPPYLSVLSGPNIAYSKMYIQFTLSAGGGELVKKGDSDRELERELYIYIS